MENNTGLSEVDPQEDEPKLEELEHLLVEEIGMWKMLGLGHPYQHVHPNPHETAAGVEALCRLLGDMGIISGEMFRKKLLEVQITTLAEIRRDIIANKPIDLPEGVNPN